MSQLKTNEFLASSLERFHAALIVKFEAETGLAKTTEEPNAAFGARVQRTIGYPRFKELAEQTAHEVSNFKLPQA